jgi:polyvinyl alcohol dehydrogenase (cytochrome)
MSFSRHSFGTAGSAGLAGLLLLACSSSGSDNTKAPEQVKPQTSADWTRLGYDLGSTYNNTAETKITVDSAKNLAKAWDFDTGGTVTATPLISGGKAYVMTSQGSPAGAIAINLADGKEAWRIATVSGNPFGGWCTMAIEDNILYTNDTAGTLRAFDMKDQSMLWEYKPEETWLVGFSSPIVTKDFVIVGTSGLEEVAPPQGGFTTRGHVLAVNKVDGTLAWKHFNVDAPSTGNAVWSTVSVDETAGLVIAGTGNTYGGPATDMSDAFLAIPLKDGGPVLWHPQIVKNDVYPSVAGSPDGDFGANPILYEVNGRKLAAGGAKMGDVWIVDRADGSIVKQRNLGPGSSFRGGIFVNGAFDGTNLLFACNGAKSTGAGSKGSAAALFALDPLTLDVVWEREIEGVVFSPISVANGVGFFGNDKTLQAFNTKTGEVLFEFPTEGTIATAPAISDGYVVFGSGMQWIGSTAGSKYYALKVP